MALLSMRRIDLASGMMATVISVVGDRAFLQAVGNCVVWTRLLSLERIS